MPNPPNPLTGAFEVVAQVSGLTINRLLATLHQNPHANPGQQPTVPSHITARLGDAGFAEAVDGVRGTVWAQIGVPSVELIHEARDAVWVVAPVRAYFRADPGSAAFPEFVHGLVRAKYRLVAIATPEGIYGTTGSGPRLWVGVDPDSITFTSRGSTAPDRQITAQVRAILTRRIPVRPQPLMNDFAAGRFLSLVGPNGESAVCHPLGSGGSDPPGDLATVREIFLGGRDLAVAVSRQYVLAQLQPLVDAFKTSTFPPFPVEAGPFSGSYSVYVDTADAKWSALGAILGLTPVGTITLTIAGEARTYDTAMPDATFLIVDDVWVSFDAATETLSVVAGGRPAVSAHLKGAVGGVFDTFSGGAIRARMVRAVTDAYNAAITGVMATAAAKLQPVLGEKQKLIEQLQTLDPQATARFDATESHAEGFVLRGRIGLSRRLHRPQVIDKLSDDTGYTAFRYVIPGGVIDEYHWRWYFTTGPVPSGSAPDGAETHADRFLLRPAAPVPGIRQYPPGAAQPEVPTGRVCLRIRGRVINEVTGDEDKIDTVAMTGEEPFCVDVLPP